MKLKLLKKIIRSSKDNFCSKLVPDNHSADFHWENYSIQTAEILSKLISLNEKHHDNSINIQQLQKKCFEIIEIDSIKRINKFKNLCLNDELPFSIKSYNETQILTYHYFTKILLVEKLIDHRFFNEKDITDEEFKAIMIILQYKQSIALIKLYKNNLNHVFSSLIDEEIPYINIKDFEDNVLNINLPHPIDESIKVKISDIYHNEEGL